MPAPDDPALKAVLVSLMRRGIIMPSEAATVAGVSRQSVAAWLPAPPGAAQARRWRYVGKQVDYALRMHDQAAQVRDRTRKADL